MSEIDVDILRDILGDHPLCSAQRKALEYAIELASAKRDGHVVETPCNVGDTVFVLTPDSLEGYEETKINRIVIKKNKMFLNADCKNDDWGSAAWELSPHDFGKKVFLTKSEAERALAATEPKGDAT